MKLDKNRKISIILAAVGFLFMLRLVIFLLNSQGFIGLIRWEKSYRLYFVILCLVTLITIDLGILSIYSKIVSKISKIFSILMCVLATAAITFLMIMGNQKPKEESNLNFYYSKDSYISQTDEMTIAVFSDTHWGGSSSNPEMRHKILETIGNNNYDLVIHSGDVVDLGIFANDYQVAIDEMEETLGNTRVSFVMGNHDALVASKNNFKNYLQKEETSFNHVLELSPHVHWVIFNFLWDMSEVKKSDLRWLEETLASYPEEDLVVVESHGYIYASGSVSEGGGPWYDIEKAVEKLEPILKDGHVDLMVSGHVHSYELMQSNGIFYCLVGLGGGSVFEDFSIPTNANQMDRPYSDYGYTTFSIKDGSIKINFIDYNGTSLTEFEFNYQ